MYVGLSSSDPDPTHFQPCFNYRPTQSLVNYWKQNSKQINKLTKQAHFLRSRRKQGEGRKTESWESSVFSPFSLLSSFPFFPFSPLFFLFPFLNLFPPSKTLKFLFSPLSLLFINPCLVLSLVLHLALVVYSGRMSSGSFRVSIPDGVRRVIQNIREIARNHSEDEVHAMLKECNMDPNETVQKLLHQGHLSDSISRDSFFYVDLESMQHLMTKFLGCFGAKGEILTCYFWIGFGLKWSLD